MRHAIVIGDVMVDVVARTTGPFEPGSDTPARVRSRPGGSAATVAAWLAVAGVPVTLVGRVGDDHSGHSAIRKLKGHGVHACVALDDRRPTGTCVVVVHPDGERSMLPDPGANAALTSGDLPLDRFVAGAHLHVTGYTLLREESRPAALHALRLARAAGMTISVDPSSAAPIAAAGATNFLDWTGRVDVLFPNWDEATTLTGRSDPGAAGARLVPHAREVVVTLGAEGAMWTDGRNRVHAPAVARGPVEDTTGAGDAFAAGFLSTWLAGASPSAALGKGCELGARALAIAARWPGDD